LLCERGEGAFRPFLVMSQKRRRINPYTKPSKRILVCSSITALYAIGRRQEAARILRDGLERLKIPRAMFSELFLHLSLLLGFPAMLDGFEMLLVLKPLEKQPGSPHPRRLHTRRGGLAILSRIYGNQTKRLLRRLDELHPELPARIVEDAYGRIVSRAGLSLREREIVSVVALALGGYRRQLYSHVRGALRVGVPPRTLGSVLTAVERLTGRDLEFAKDILRMLTA